MKISAFSAQPEPGICLFAFDFGLSFDFAVCCGGKVGGHYCRAMWVEPGRDYGSRVTDNVRAGTDITKELEAAKGRIISQWPLTPQE
eukprot:1010817-Rhodomonas_salina.1